MRLVFMDRELSLRTKTLIVIALYAKLCVYVDIANSSVLRSKIILSKHHLLDYKNI